MRLVTHVNKSCLSHIWMCLVTYVNESWHAHCLCVTKQQCAWSIMTHSYVWYSYEKWCTYQHLSVKWGTYECHTYGSVTSHIRMSHVTRMNELCRTYEWVVSYISRSYVWHDSFICVTFMCEMMHNISCRAHMHSGLKRHVIVGGGQDSFTVSDSCLTYEWVMSHVWMRHGTRMNASNDTHEWVMSHVWTRHVTCMNESCHTWECWIRMHHATCMIESCHTKKSVVSRIWMSHVIRTSGCAEQERVMMSLGTSFITESCRTHEWVMAHMNEWWHTWMSQVTHMNESCRTHEWMVLHMDESCHPWLSCHTWDFWTRHQDTSSQRDHSCVTWPTMTSLLNTWLTMTRLLNTISTRWRAPVQNVSWRVMTRHDTSHDSPWHIFSTRPISLWTRRRFTNQSVMS